MAIAESSLASLLVALRENYANKKCDLGLSRSDVNPGAVASARLTSKLPVQEAYLRTLQTRVQSTIAVRSQLRDGRIEECEKYISMLRERHAGITARAERVRSKIQILRKVYAFASTVNETEAKHQLYLKSASALAERLQGALLAIHNSNLLLKEIVKDEAALSAEIRLPSVFLRIAEDVLPAVELISAEESDPSFVSAATAAAQSVAAGQTVKRILTIKRAGEGVPRVRDWRKKIGAGKAGAVEAMKLCAGNILTHRGFLRHLPEKLSPLPMFSLRMPLDFRIVAWLDYQMFNSCPLEIYFCVNEYYSALEALRDEIFSVPTTATSAWHNISGGIRSYTRSPDVQSALLESGGNFTMWRVKDTNADGTISAQAPGGGCALLYARATIRHLLSSVPAGAIAATLPASIRKQLNDAFPQGTVVDNALTSLWRVRNGFLEPIDDAMMGELFTAYVSRANAVAVTSLAAFPGLTTDTFVTLLAPILPVTRENGAQYVPVAVVQLEGGGTAEATEPLPNNVLDSIPLLCSVTGCCAPTLRGSRLCLLHYGQQRAAFRAPPPVPKGPPPLMKVKEANLKFLQTISNLVSDAVQAQQGNVRATSGRGRSETKAQGSIYRTQSEPRPVIVTEPDTSDSTHTTPPDSPSQLAVPTSPSLPRPLSLFSSSRAPVRSSSLASPSSVHSPRWAERSLQSAPVDTDEPQPSVTLSTSLSLTQVPLSSMELAVKLRELYTTSPLPPPTPPSAVGFRRARAPATRSFRNQTDSAQSILTEKSSPYTTGVTRRPKTRERTPKRSYSSAR